MKQPFFRTTVFARFYAVRRQLIATLLAAFVFASLHTVLHNPYDHPHDAACSVYVLEQLFFGTDTAAAAPLIIFFIPFLFIFPPSPRYRYRPAERFQIRAPPLS